MQFRVTLTTWLALKKDWCFSLDFVLIPVANISTGDYHFTKTSFEYEMRKTDVSVCEKLDLCFTQQPHCSIQHQLERQSKSTTEDARQIWLGYPEKFWLRSQRRWSYWALVVSVMDRWESLTTLASRLSRTLGRRGFHGADQPKCRHRGWLIVISQPRPTSAKKGVWLVRLWHLALSSLPPLLLLFPSSPQSLALSKLNFQSRSWLLSSMAELTYGMDGGWGECVVHIL